MNTIEQTKKALNSINRNNKKDSLIIPLELKNQNFPSYLSISSEEENYLNVDLNQDLNEISEKIIETTKLIEEKTSIIENYEFLLNNQKKQKNDLEQNIIQTKNLISKEKLNQQ